MHQKFYTPELLFLLFNILVSEVLSSLPGWRILGLLLVLFRQDIASSSRNYTRD